MITGLLASSSHARCPDKGRGVEQWFHRMTRQSVPYGGDRNRCELQTQWLLGHAEGVDLRRAHVLWFIPKSFLQAKVPLSAATFGQGVKDWNFHVMLEADRRAYDLSLKRPLPAPRLDQYLRAVVPADQLNKIMVVRIPAETYRQRFPLGRSALSSLNQFRPVPLGQMLRGASGP